MDGSKTRKEIHRKERGTWKPEKADSISKKP